MPGGFPHHSPHISFAHEAEPAGDGSGAIQQYLPMTLKLASITALTFIQPTHAQRVTSLGQTIVHTSSAPTSNAHSTVGLPQNNGAFWDGTRYWFFYCEGAELRAKFGTSLDGLQTTPTDPSGGNISGLTNLAKSYSVVFGRLGEKWRAWALVNRTGSPFAVYRWDLTETGLVNGTSTSPSVSPKPEPTHVSLMPGYRGFDIADLYGVVNDSGSSSANRQVRADFATTIGLGGIIFGKSNAEDTFDFGEAEWVFELSDGYVYNAVNVGDFRDPRVGGDVRRDGNFGNFSEWKRSGIGGTSTWSAEIQLEGEPPNQVSGDWSDSNYGRNTSHGGQTDFVQLADGTIYCAYVDNFDTKDGNFGNVVVKRRGAALADGWTTVTTNAVPNDGKAWHVALTSDGSRVALFYLKNTNDTPGVGVRAGAISLRVFNPSVGIFGGEQIAAAIAPGSRFERMTTQWRFTDSRLTLLWSETADESTYFTKATALSAAPALSPWLKVEQAPSGLQLVIEGLVPGEAYLVESSGDLEKWIAGEPFIATSTEITLPAPSGSGETKKFHGIRF